MSDSGSVRESFKRVWSSTDVHPQRCLNTLFSLRLLVTTKMTTVSRKEGPSNMKRWGWSPFEWSPPRGRSWSLRTDHRWHKRHLLHVRLRIKSIAAQRGASGTVHVWSLDFSQNRTKHQCGKAFRRIGRSSEKRPLFRNGLF